MQSKKREGTQRSFGFPGFATSLPASPLAAKEFNKLYYCSLRAIAGAQQFKPLSANWRRCLYSKDPEYFQRRRY
jgi:hypothetical protein